MPSPPRCPVVTRGWHAARPRTRRRPPRPDEAVRALLAGGGAPGPVVVATYLLAPGYFADKIRAAGLGAGAVVVSAALGAAPDIADVVLERYLAAVPAELCAPLAARA